MDVGEISLERANKFCYLANVTGKGGGAEASSPARIRGGWKKLRECLPLLMSRGPLHLKGNIHNTCMESVMVYGTET